MNYQIDTYEELQGARARVQKILVSKGCYTDNPKLTMRDAQVIMDLNHAIKQAALIEHKLLARHNATKSNNSSIKTKSVAPMKTTKLTQKVTNDHLSGKAMASQDIQVAIDKQFITALVERARKQGGIFSDVEIEVVDSVKIKPNLIKLTEAQVTQYIEQTGNTDNGIIRDQTGTPTAVLPVVHMDEGMFKELVSREVITDPTVNMVQWLLDSAEGSFVERFSLNFVAGESATQKEFNGIMTGYYDPVESDKPDSLRGIEYLQAFKSGVVGSVGASNPTADNNTIDNIRGLIDTLPTKHREKAKFYMHKSVYTQLKNMKTTTGAPAFDTKGQTLEDFPVVLDDFFPEPQTDTFTAENILVFGDINAAMKVVAHPAPLDINPYKADGGTTYEQVQRLSSWVKDNTALKILRGE